MKSILKFLISLSLLLSLFACSSLPTEEDSSSVKSSVKFTMQNVSATNSNILFSATDGETPSKVAISYKKSGEGEAETSTTIELTAFGSSYITDDVLSLYEGSYEVTKFDVLNDEGTTIYSTPKAGSEKAKDLNITTALAYSFEVKEGEISTERMQVVAVSDTTDPADFGHAAFTFDKVDFSKFYIEVLVLDDSLGWVYTTAQVDVLNSENTNIKTASLENKMNKLIVANSTSYTITISKDGYASQEFTFTKAKLEAYESKAMVVKLKKNTNISTEGLVAYYPFNGNANDESGTGNDGTVYGSTLTTDRFGNENSAYSFDGNDDYISVADAEMLRLNNTDFTLSCWIYQESFNVSYGSSIIAKRDRDGGQADGWSWGIAGKIVNSSTGEMSYAVSGGGDPQVISKSKIVLNKWYHLVITYEKSYQEISFFIDNVLDASANSIPTPNANTSEGLCIGKDTDINTNGYYFDGIIDDLRIYNCALSQEEITALYNEAK